MRYMIKIVCVFMLLLSTLFAKVSYVSYSDEVELTTQYNTGVYWRDNCGAASVYMGLDYLDIDFGNVEEIRRIIKNHSGWLYTDEIETFLDDRGISYGVRYISDIDSLIEAIDKGIVMLCVDASRISGKDYSNVTGHFIVVVGYMMDSNGCRLEVYDPMSREKVYYDLENVFEASENWWRWMFVFEK